MNRVLILGATGFVGRHVAPALEAAGFTLRRASRRPERAREAHGGDWVYFDVDDPEPAAFEDVDAVLYLVHQMRSGSDDLTDREVRAAERVAELAAVQGVGRIVFLGAPDTAEPSHHLAARLGTGQALRAGSVPAVELQAAMIVGAGSESWWICRDLALRLPAMTLPPWASSKSEPIGIRDVVTALVRCVEMPLEHSMVLPLPGPEVLSAEDILRRIAQQAGFEPWMVHVPFLTPRISSHWLRFVTRANFSIAQQLVDGLEHDLVSEGRTFWDHHPDLRPTPFDDAIAEALREDAPPPRSLRAWERVVRTLGRRPRVAGT